MPSPKNTKGPIVKTGPTAGQNGRQPVIINQRDSINPSKI